MEMKTEGKPSVSMAQKQKQSLAPQAIKSSYEATYIVQWDQVFRLPWGLSEDF